MDVAKRVLQWRWLIIDEISMVSARLLAEMDVRLRSVVRDIGTQKVHDGRYRVFGGLNVLCSGDFWQLDPPEGGFSGGYPCRVHFPREETCSGTYRGPWSSAHMGQR